MKSPIRSLLKTLLQVSWLALTLAALIELLVFGINLTSGQGESFSTFVLSMVKKIAWTLPLCAVLALIRQSGFLMGAAGFLVAPVATLFSSVLESQLKELFMAMVTQPFSLATLRLAGIRGFEYAFLGAAIGYLSERGENGFLNHTLVGLLTGLIFGAVLVVPQAQALGANLLDLVIKNIGELIIPLGCSLILKIVSQAKG